MNILLMDMNLFIQTWLILIQENTKNTEEKRKDLPPLSADERDIVQQFYNRYRDQSRLRHPSQKLVNAAMKLLAASPQ